MDKKEKKKLYNKNYREKMKEKAEKSPPEPITKQENNFFFRQNLINKEKEQAIMSTIPILMSILCKTGYTIFQKISLKQSQQEESTEYNQPQPVEYMNVVTF